MTSQINLVATTGIPPSSWGIGLQVMLEKIAGVALVNKLRAIQLYEADFNFFNQFFFGQKALQALKSSGSLPEELYNQKGTTSEDAFWDKVLRIDLSFQLRQSMVIVSVVAANDTIESTTQYFQWYGYLFSKKTNRRSVQHYNVCNR